MPIRRKEKELAPIYPINLNCAAVEIKEGEIGRMAAREKEGPRNCCFSIRGEQSSRETAENPSIQGSTSSGKIAACY